MVVRSAKAALRGCESGTPRVRKCHSEGAKVPLLNSSLKIRFVRNVLVISNLKLDMEYSIPLSFIMTLTTFSDANDALKAQSSLLVPLA